jgi:RNase H-fold protein (predicted Holliday junction resolvase)
MNETGTFGKKRKEAIDTLSAQIILQNYLDKKKNTGSL